MFNLEKSIAGWRRQLLANGLRTPATLDELEIHLREDIEGQMKLGVSAEAAFYSAAGQLGPADKMQREFAKVGGFVTIGNWTLPEYFLAAFTVLLPLLMGSIIVCRASVVGLSGTQQILSLAALVAFSGLAWAGRLGHSAFPAVTNRYRRIAIGASATLLVAAWWFLFLRVVLPRYDFTVAQFFTAFTCAWFPPGGAWVGLYWGMETAARKRA